MTFLKKSVCMQAANGAGLCSFGEEVLILMISYPQFGIFVGILEVGDLGIWSG